MKKAIIIVLFEVGPNIVAVNCRPFCLSSIIDKVIKRLNVT